MKATINLEFTDEELARFVERQVNKLVVSGLGNLADNLGPLMPMVQDVVARAVAVARAGGEGECREWPSCPLSAGGASSPSR